MKVLPRTDPRYKKWKIKNATVMGWLLNSRKPTISDHFLFLEIAHQIWDVLAKSYSEMGYTVKVYELRQRIVEFK